MFSEREAGTRGKFLLDWPAMATAGTIMRKLDPWAASTKWPPFAKMK